MEELHARQLRLDPRVEEGKKLILQALFDQQQKVEGVRESNPALKIEYDQILETFAQVRAGKLWYPYLGSGFGKGALVELLDGSIKYDMISGIGPHYFGHCDLGMANVLLDSALSDTVMQGHLQQNKESFDLSALLQKASGLDHVFLSSTGVMADENGLKIIFQKKFPKTRIIAFEHGFAGRTLAVSQITDKPAYRQGLPDNLAVDYIPFYDYREPEKSTKKALEALKEHLHRYPCQHAAMIFELVQGEGGFYPGTKEFFVTLMQCLKDHDVAIMVDEVQTFARTPELFAYQYFGLQEFVDVVAIGKVSQVCATLYTKEYAPKPGLLSQTFTSATSAIFSSHYLIQTLLDKNFFGPGGKIDQFHNRFVSNFEKMEEGLVSGPYGIGAMFAFTPYHGEADRVLSLTKRLFEKGVIAFIAGANPTRVRFLAPVHAMEEYDIDQVSKIVEEALIEGK